MNIAEENRLMTVPEAARVLGISRAKCWDLTYRGELPTVRIDRSVRISSRTLEQFIREHESGKH